MTFCYNIQYGTRCFTKTISTNEKHFSEIEDLALNQVLVIFSAKVDDRIRIIKYIEQVYHDKNLEIKSMLLEKHYHISKIAKFCCDFWIDISCCKYKDICDITCPDCHKHLFKEMDSVYKLNIVKSQNQNLPRERSIDSIGNFGDVNNNNIKNNINSNNFNSIDNINNINSIDNINNFNNNDSALVILKEDNVIFVKLVPQQEEIDLDNTIEKIKRIQQKEVDFVNGIQNIKKEKVVLVNTIENIKKEKVGLVNSIGNIKKEKVDKTHNHNSSSIIMLNNGTIFRHHPYQRKKVKKSRVKSEPIHQTKISLDDYKIPTSNYDLIMSYSKLVILNNLSNENVVDFIKSTLDN